MEPKLVLSIYYTQLNNKRTRARAMVEAGAIKTSGKRLKSNNSFNEENCTTIYDGMQSFQKPKNFCFPIFKRVFQLRIS